MEDDRKNVRIILIDMDNTITDYSQKMAEELSKIYPNGGITKDNWFEDSGLTSVRKYIQSRSGFFFSLQPIDGALDALRELDQRYTIFIVSSPSDTCHSDKVKWIKHHFGEKWARKLILTKDKTMIVGDILIDDKIEINGESHPTWRHILFGQSYNKHSDLPRIDSWNDWTDWTNKIIK